MPSSPHLLRCLVAGVVVAAGPSAAGAQGWPTRAIQVISPFSAGSANEIVARIVLDQVSRQIGQSIVVENRPGGGGTLGAALVANADPRWIHAAAALLIAERAGRPAQDAPLRCRARFRADRPVRHLASVLITAPSKGFRSLADVVAAAKAKPGALNYASAGIGSASHMAAERLRVASGIEAQHIPFRGPIEAFTEVMAGRIDFYFLPIAPALPVINDGKVLALAVSTRKRAVALPNVPTVAEAGYPGAEYLFWGGLAAPAKTPRDIIDKLHRECEKALRLHAIGERLAQLGVEQMPMSVEQFDEFFRDDVAATVKLAREARILPAE